MYVKDTGKELRLIIHASSNFPIRKLVRAELALKHVGCLYYLKWSILGCSYLGKKPTRLLKGQLCFFSIFFWASQYLSVSWQQMTLNISFGDLWQNSLFSLQVTAQEQHEVLVSLAVCG